MAKKKTYRRKSRKKPPAPSNPVAAIVLQNAPPSTLSGQDEAFCVEYAITQSQCKAAVASGRKPSSGWEIYQREDIRKRIAEITPDVLKTLQSYRVTEHVVAIGRVLLNYEYIACIDKPDPLFGFKFQIEAGDRLLEIHKLIAPRGHGGVRIQAGAQVNANSPAVGLPLELSYRPRWLLQTEAKLAKKFEQEAIDARTIEGVTS